MSSTDAPGKILTFLLLSLPENLCTLTPTIIESPTTKTIFFGLLCLFEIGESGGVISALREDLTTCEFSF